MRDFYIDRDGLCRAWVRGSLPPVPHVDSLSIRIRARLQKCLQDCRIGGEVGFEQHFERSCADAAAAPVVLSAYGIYIGTCCHERQNDLLCSLCLCTMRLLERHCQSSLGFPSS